MKATRYQYTKTLIELEDRDVELLKAYTQNPPPESTEEVIEMCARLFKTLSVPTLAVPTVSSENTMGFLQSEHVRG